MSNLEYKLTSISGDEEQRLVSESAASMLAPVAMGERL